MHTAIVWVRFSLYTKHAARRQTSQLARYVAIIYTLCINLYTPKDCERIATGAQMCARTFHTNTNTDATATVTALRPTTVRIVVLF